LEKYFDAWQKFQRNEIKEKEWQQFQFARRLEWQPPTTVPESKTVEGSAIIDEEVDEIVREASTAPALKRSYTTSALNDFGKLFGQDEAARAQANEAIVEEIFRSKDDLEISPKSQPLEVASVRASSISEQPTNSSPATVYTPIDSQDDLLASEHMPFTQELVYLAKNKQYADIPIVFKEMLRAGVQQPTPAAYHALLTSALGLTRSKTKGCLRLLKSIPICSGERSRLMSPPSAS